MVRTFLILSLVMSAWTCATQQVPAAAAGQTRNLPTTSAAIGPAGGVLTLPDGAKLVVPAGALQRTTTISLSEYSPPSNLQLSPSAVRVGKFYSIEPRLTSPVPIEITLPYEAARLPAGYEEGSISIYQLRTDGRLSMVGSVTSDPTSESSGQALDIERDQVSIRVPLTATYTLLALKTE